MTFSIVATDGSSWGVAVASKFLAVGGAVPAARAGVGAIATQASANVAWKGAALALLRTGKSAPEVVDQLVREDGQNDRQVGVVDASGLAATHTGAACLTWAGGITLSGVAIQGNILTGPEVVEAMADAWSATVTEAFPHRLLSALQAGDAAGGDRRGRQSAALYVVREGAGYGELDDVAVDLRVDDAAAPLPELARLLDLNDFYLSAPAPEDRLSVSDAERAELEQWAQQHGHANFADWVGTQNYEMRVADDLSWIDPRILEIMRTQQR